MMVLLHPTVLDFSSGVKVRTPDNARRGERSVSLGDLQTTGEKVRFW